MENAVKDVYRDLVALFGADNVEVFKDPEDKFGRTLLIVEREFISVVGQNKLEFFKSIIFKAKNMFVCLDGNKVRFTIVV